MKQKILFFSHNSNLNGAQYMLLLTIKNLDRNKFSCAVICPTKGQLVNELDKLGVKTYIIPTFNWIFGDKRSLIRHCIRSIISITFQIITIPIFLIINLIEKPDIIYSNTILNCTGMLLSILTKKPHVWHVHETYTDEFYSSYISKNSITNLATKYSDKIIAVSNVVAAQFNNKSYSNKIMTIYNCLNDKRLQATSQADSSYIFTNDDWVISLVGYITPLKKQDLAINAINELIPEVPNIKLLLIGASTNNNNYEKELIYLVKSLCLGDNVVFLGRRNDVIDILRNSKVLIIASPREGLPIVALEAMYCSVPIVASNSGGNIEVVKDNVNGLLFKPNDFKDLSEKILHLYNNPNLIETYGHNGNEILHEHFSAERYMKSIEEALSQ